MALNLEQLKRACENGDLRGARYLLNTQWGRDFCEGDEMDNCMYPPDGDRLLHVASHSGNHHLVRLLLDRGATVNLSNNQKRTPLHLACKQGYAKVIDVLLKRQGGIFINAPDAEECTPLHHAAQSGCWEAIDKLAKHKFRSPQESVNPNPINSDGSTPMHLAASQGKSQTVLGLVEDIHADKNCVNNQGSTPLHYACANGHEKCAIILIAAKANHSVHDNEGKTPMQRAIENGHRFLFKRIIPP